MNMLYTMLNKSQTCDLVSMVSFKLSNLIMHQFEISLLLKLCDDMASFGKEIQHFSFKAEYLYFIAISQQWARYFFLNKTKVFLSDLKERIYWPHKIYINILQQYFQQKYSVVKHVKHQRVKVITYNHIPYTYNHCIAEVCRVAIFQFIICKINKVYQLFDACNALPE